MQMVPITAELLNRYLAPNDSCGFVRLLTRASHSFTQINCKRQSNQSSIIEAMVNHEKKASKAPTPSGSSRGAESRAMQIPPTGQKQFKTAKVKFLAVEEAIKLSACDNSRDKNTKGVRIGNRRSQSGPSQPLPAIPESTGIMDKVTSSKCVPMEDEEERKKHQSNDENYCFELPSHDSTTRRSTKKVQSKDRPAGLVASAINSKPSTSMIMSKKDMTPCSTELPSELKEIKTKGFRPEKEAKLDLEKRVRPSNGENDSTELPCNGSTLRRLTKKVHFEDTPARLVASAINSKSSTSMFMSKKDMKLCSTELPSELKEIETKGFRPEKEAKFDLEKKVRLSNGENDSIGLPSNNSKSGRSTKRVHFEDTPARLVASAINSKPGTSMFVSKKEMKPCGTELPSKLKEVEPKGFRPEQEAELDLEKRGPLSNGENDSIELLSNGFTSERPTKKVQLKDRPARLVASAINSKPSTSMIVSKKETKPCGTELPSEVKDIEPKGFRHEQEAELDLEKRVHLSNGENDSTELLSNGSTSGRPTTKVQFKDRPARFVASAINSKPSTGMIMSKKDIRSCSTELPSELKEIVPKEFRPEQEAALDLEKKTHLSNGENDCPELPSNDSTLGRSTKEVILARLVASVIQSKPGTNMIISQKDMKSCGNKLPTGMKEIHGPQSKAMLDLNRGKGTSSEIMKHTSLIPSNLQNYPPNEPAQAIIWKGSFVILDGHKIYEGFFARSPENVCPKASDFSKQMAQVLQFKVCPRSDRWPKIFQIDAPDENDIALYFYPGHFERSKENYTSLLMLMEEYDMVIKSRMEDVELIVFPSKWLPTDFQTLEGSHFMWGAFRTLKDSKMT